MSIKLQCPDGHFIATVNLTDTGFTPSGVRHGLTWDYAPSAGITRMRARCFARHCGYDGSIDYRALCAQLAAAAARGETKHRLTH